jgi:hypothetical protein
MTLTPEQRAANVVFNMRMPQGDLPNGWANDIEERIADAIRAAVLAEREACAALLDSMADTQRMLAQEQIVQKQKDQAARYAEMLLLAARNLRARATP